MKLAFVIPDFSGYCMHEKDLGVHVRQSQVKDTFTIKKDVPCDFIVWITMIAAERVDLPVPLGPMIAAISPLSFKSQIKTLSRFLYLRQQST